MNNRSKYSKTFMQIVDIIAAFFTDKLVNDLYYKAKNKAYSNGTTVTDEYLRIIMHYSNGITHTPAHCKKVISELHNYYSKVTKHASITYMNFEDDVLRQFIPPEYFNDFMASEKTATLSAIVTNAIQTAVVYVHAPAVLGQIIDCRGGKGMQSSSGLERNSAGNLFYNETPSGGTNDVNFALAIQDHIADSLISQRNEFYLDFAKKINEKSQKVSVELVQKMRDELKSQIERRVAAERSRNKALAIIQQLVEKINAMSKQLEAAQTPPQQLPSYDYYARRKQTIEPPARTDNRSQERSSNPFETPEPPQTSQNRFETISQDISERLKAPTLNKLETNNDNGNNGSDNESDPDDKKSLSGVSGASGASGASDNNDDIDIDNYYNITFDEFMND